MSQSSSADATRVVFQGKQQVVLEPITLGKPADHEVRVRTHLSLMSTGTENIIFNRLFDPGSHWDNWITYPFYPGYSSVGVIEEVGADGAKHLRKGQRIAFRAAHASAALHKVVDCCPIPDEVPFEQAVWFGLAKITAMGARAAKYSLGDSVLIIGGGPIGQMSVRWARAAGCARIIVVDPAAHRLPLAKAGGATAVIDLPIDKAREAVLAAGGGKLPRVVMDSTGNAAVFSAALGLAADRGTVVIMGDTGAPAKQTLTPDVILRGLTIIGAHDGHDTPDWNGSGIIQLFFELVASGRFNMEGLTSHVFAAKDATEAYAAANRDRATTMGLIIDWTGELKNKK